MGYLVEPLMTVRPKITKQNRSIDNEARFWIA